MVNANLTRVEQDVKLVNNNTADAGQDRLKDEAEAEKLKGVSADQVKIIETRLLEKQLRDKHLSEKHYKKDLADCMASHSKGQQEECMAQLRAQSQFEYVDETLPLTSAAFTSLAWQAVAAKKGTQVCLVVGMMVFFCGHQHRTDGHYL